MNDDCIFCKIIKGEIPSFTLYEDEEIKVFMDVSPASKGHSLYIPKEHFSSISDVPEEKIKFLRKLPKIVPITNTKNSVISLQTQLIA